jgi:hypothetical protein
VYARHLNEAGADLTRAGLLTSTPKRLDNIVRLAR